MENIHDIGTQKKIGKILFICGSMNQTTQMHEIAARLREYSAYFSPFYAEGMLDWCARNGLVDFTIMGKKNAEKCLRYLGEHNLPIDYRGTAGSYDLIVTCADLIIPANIRNTPIVLVQEGMTDPENLSFHLVKNFRFLPRWFASTSAMGLSGSFAKFCVASPGYRALFIRKGVAQGKIVVTGIPNFDNCARFLNNNFPYRNFVLVCTSDNRETFRWENRKKTIHNAQRIAQGRQLVFKLHPNENFERARREILYYAPDALVFTEGKTEEMIANCDVLITQYSSTVYVGLALDKEVYSKFDVAQLRNLLPLQHGMAAANIADVCRGVLGHHTHTQHSYSDVEQESEAQVS